HGKPLWFKTPGGVLIVAGARSGKLRDILAQNILTGVLTRSTLLILDIKGELAAISQDQTADRKYCLYWNPFALHGLPQHKINPFGHIKWSSKWLYSDVKLALEALVPKSGAPQAQYFELNARRVLEAIALTLVKIHGVLRMPDLYDAVLWLNEDGARWNEFAGEMYDSGIPLCRSVEAEIHAARDDSSGGWKGVIGEAVKSLACLSDPTLRESLSPPYDAELADLCRSDQAYQFYLMCPPEFIEGWAPVIKSIFSSAKVLKIRNPSSPKQTWIIDEAARLKGFEEVVQLFTDGAGIGIRPIAVFQDVTQMNDLAANGMRKISSSAALQFYFGIRDLETARRVSEMLGKETLHYNDYLMQRRSDLQLRKAVWSVLNGSGSTANALEIKLHGYEAARISLQQRSLKSSDEIMNMGDNHMIVFGDELPGPAFVDRIAYWLMRMCAGRFLPNPYHPPLDQVLCKTLWGSRWFPVVTREVPDEFKGFPQYPNGMGSFVEGFGTKVFR
ncbi:MAG: type IV secretory system conjugative DNA transfer family protein, partial [Pseudomonadota bacterium]